MINIAICTPCRGGFSDVYVGTMLALTSALTANRIGWQWVRVMDRPIVHARNDLVRVALASPATHVLWVDADSGFHADDMGKLLSVDQDMVSLAFLRRPGEDQPRTRRRQFNVGLDLESEPVRGAVKADQSGFAGVFMRRQVLERVADAYPALECGDGLTRQPALFHEIVAEGAHHGEDTSFCRRWRAIGGDIWVLLDAETNHANAIGHIGREIWAHRAELRVLFDELLAIIDESQTARAELVALAKQVANPSDLSRIRALCAAVPKGRPTSPPCQPPSDLRASVAAAKDVLVAVKAELARLGAPSEAAQ